MKPIDKLDFWKERIEQAHKNGREHYSVYISPDKMWRDIEIAHRDYLKELIKPEETVLDAGCGYGRMSEYIEKYTGVDFSPDFIEMAKKKYPNKDFVVGSLKELPFKDGEFDWAFCVSIKKMVVANSGDEEWQKMEKELKRVAKKVLILEYETARSYEII